MTRGRIVCLALALAGALWFGGYMASRVGVGGRICAVQAKVYWAEGRAFFGDWFLTRTCAEEGYAGPKLERAEACYPAFTPLLTRPFPKTATGASSFTFLSWGLFVLAAGALARGQPFWAKAALCVAAGSSSAMLYAIEWGNPVILAGAVVVFWAFGRTAESPRLRMMAAVALAVATVMKVTPAVFALLYCVEGRARKRELTAWLIASLVLFALPFAFVGGFGEIGCWMRNAVANAATHVHMGAWGAVPIGRTVRVLLGVDVSTPWAGIGWERAVSVVVGLMALAAGLRARREYLRLLGLTAALLLVPGNMHFYTGIYLIPAFVAWLAEGESPQPSNRDSPQKSVGDISRKVMVFEGVLWFFVFCPFQIPFGAGCLNHPLANLAFLTLLVGQAWEQFCMRKIK